MTDRDSRIAFRRCLRIRGFDFALGRALAAEPAPAAWRRSHNGSPVEIAEFGDWSIGRLIDLSHLPWLG